MDATTTNGYRILSLEDTNLTRKQERKLKKLMKFEEEHSEITCIINNEKMLNFVIKQYEDLDYTKAGRNIKIAGLFEAMVPGLINQELYAMAAAVGAAGLTGLIYNGIKFFKSRAEYKPLIENAKLARKYIKLKNGLLE